MSFKLSKIDAIIVVTLIVIAGVVLTKAGFIPVPMLEGPEPSGPPDEILLPPPPPSLPTSLLPEYAGFIRAVSSEDEGLHFDKINICREWWYFSATLTGENSELKDWVMRWYLTRSRLRLKG